MQLLEYNPLMSKLMYWLKNLIYDGVIQVYRCKI